MKKLEEILKQEPVYLHDWTNKFGLVADFEDIYLSEEAYNSGIKDHSYERDDWFNERMQKMKEALEKYEPRHILFASYGQACYSGDAWVLFEENGKLYEVNGGHCSCYGLEGQWEPEEVTLEEIEYRVKAGKLGDDRWSGNVFKNELIEFLGIEIEKETIDENNK